MIIIEVRDGFVCDVWSDTPGEYILVDWDTEEHVAETGENWVMTLPVSDIKCLFSATQHVIDTKMVKE